MNRALAGVLAAVSLILLFWRLDGALLWRDEATTANWARLMAEGGEWIPAVYGRGRRQLVVQAPDGHDFNDRLQPAMQGWLQFYVAAASFKLFGTGTAAARLPFALAGLLALIVLYRLGRLLFEGPAVFLLPAFGATSVYFLAAARQCRYYVLVFLFTSLLLVEVCRYLKDPRLAESRSFYARLALWGALLYLANYVSFAGTWAGLSLFVLSTWDWRLVRNFVLLSLALAAPMGVEYLMVHAGFAGIWMDDPRPAHELYRSAIAARGRDFWRAIPLTLLVPAGAALLWRRVGRRLKAALAVSVVIVYLPLVLWIDLSDLREEMSPAAFWLWTALCAAVPVTFAAAWWRFRPLGLHHRAMALAVAVLLVSPLLTVAVGKNRAVTRHYYQIIPAGLLLAALTARELAQRRGWKAAGALAAGLAAWPALNLNMGGFDQVLLRQFLLDRSYVGPVVDFLDARVEAGDEVAFHRNVKGMAVYFYIPRMRWVALLDSASPWNQRFRDRLPADQFDDYPGAEWCVVWDPRGTRPSWLDNRFEKVWEYAYPYRRPLWDQAGPRHTRSYVVYRRREGTQGSPAVSSPALFEDSRSTGSSGIGAAQTNSTRVSHSRTPKATVSAVPSGIKRLSSSPRTPSRTPMPAGATIVRMPTSQAEAKLLASKGRFSNGTSRTPATKNATLSP